MQELVVNKFSQLFFFFSTWTTNKPFHQSSERFNQREENQADGDIKYGVCVRNLSWKQVRRSRNKIRERPNEGKKK